jgi:uncharacterized membrane protein (Fun14 family)
MTFWLMFIVTNITLAHWGIIRMNHLKLITLRKAMTVDHLTQIYLHTKKYRVA